MTRINGWLAKSVVQAVIGIGLIGVIAYQVIANGSVPAELWSLLGVIVGYYFGAQVGETAERERTARRTAQGGTWTLTNQGWQQETRTE